ncbi:MULTISPECIES: hypothetical protein [Ralstonia]|jgi:hypothetical protein|uniref:Uncharacterized protein n=2 Tax=Ralstonia TaxID=48736 RepID=A0AAD2BY51_9RALS|nr:MULTISPECIES: hypothetical protein [Ralstonia]NOZ17902.1 hypothetical protein [Betaproteobacteria bacterium]AJW47698.1 hypothetical protein TK49_23640 [Ralstonia mannitolilytica]MBA9871355.1 hypothetical protein [Ralstonia insidiosa]MBA9915609.1 hypothetical protein [Ralstonia insidiosa]MBA9954600.1 hypothetical protein [Ralstonia insidiosa]
MADFINVAIAAIPVVNRKALDDEDRHVPAVYSVMVATGLSEGSMAAAALDVFHSEIGVDVLDDFEFFVIDPRTGRVLEQDEDHEDYSKTHLGRDVERIGDKLPGIYSVTVEAVGDDVAVTVLGIIKVAADNKPEANRKALDILWDDRLDAASCSARCHSVRCR